MVHYGYFMVVYGYFMVYSSVESPLSFHSVGGNSQRRHWWPAVAKGKIDYETRHSCALASPRRRPQNSQSAATDSSSPSQFTIVEQEERPRSRCQPATTGISASRSQLHHYTLNKFLSSRQHYYTILFPPRLMHYALATKCINICLNPILVIFYVWSA